jgi:hypothetical protein
MVRIFFINPRPACRETEKDGEGERDTCRTVKGCHQARIASNVNDTKTEAQTFRSELIIGTKPKRFDLVHILLERKQNILIWSKIILLQANRFCFGPKILGQSKAI